MSWNKIALSVERTAAGDAIPLLDEVEELPAIHQTPQCSATFNPTLPPSITSTRARA